MSGSILYPSTRPDCDVGVLFIEVSGCLPMCGHGTIGTVTVAVERGLVTPKTPGTLRLDTPAGLVIAKYRQEGEHVEAVRIVNVPSFLHTTDLAIEDPELGRLRLDVAYGGNFYAIIEPQDGFRSLDQLTPGDVQRHSPRIRKLINAAAEFVHPENPTIRGCTHVQWTGAPKHPEAHGRNAVFYGDKAIDRSPCGTGTSARLAQRHAKGLLKTGETYVHESIIGSLFRGKVEAETKVGTTRRSCPRSRAGPASTASTRIFIDDRDPYAKGFLVA
jgi:4-hydroxyproline epimerase